MVDSYRILLLGECPWVPSSMGKVTLWLASELIEMGHEVVTSCFGGPTTTLWSRVFYYNPRHQCRDDRFRDLLPDVDVPTVFARRDGLVEDAVAALGGLDAVVVYGSHHAGEIGSWVNSEVYAKWSSRGRPAVAYHQIDLPYEKAGHALSVASYSVATYPSIFSKSVAVESVGWLFRKRNGSATAEKFAEYTAVVYHGIDTNIYSEKTAKVIRESPKMVRSVNRKIVAFFSKNHPRKDYASLVRCVAKLRKRGFDVAAGAYFTNAVAVPVWDVSWLSEYVSRVEGVDMDGAILTLPPAELALGLTEPALIEIYVIATDIHAYMSRGESFGIPPLETVMLGVPTVSSDIPPQREIWGDTIPLIRTAVHMREGWVGYEPDPEHCAQVCEEILVKGQDLSRARERVLGMFTARHMAQHMLSALAKAFESPEPIAKKVSEVGEVLGLR